MAIPLIGAAIGVASSVLTWFVSRVVAMLGIGFISILGVQPLLNYVTDIVRNMFAVNTPSWLPIWQWAGVLQMDICVSIMLSAIPAKLLLSGFNSKTGGFKKLRIGGTE